MGVFDDLKNSIGGDEEDKDRGAGDRGSSGSDFASGGLDDSFDDPLDDPLGQPQQQGRQQNPSGGARRQQDAPGQAQGQAPRNPGPGKNDPGFEQQSRPQNRSQDQRPSGRTRGQGGSNPPRDSPNPQTGRPREGGTEPQLSPQTEKKLENAGMDAGGRRDSVADRQDDFAEIKSQNEQIIELLKRINQTLQNQRR